MSEKTANGRGQILSRKVKYRVETIETAMLGPIRVRSVNHTLTAEARAYKGDCDPEISYFIACVVGDDDKPIFSMCREDIDELGQLAPGAIREVVNSAVRLNMAEVEQEIKNSEASPTFDSPTD